MADLKKESTLRCVTTLAVIAVVCALLLSVLNSVLYVAPTADDLVGVYDKTEGYTWTITDLQDGSYGSGGKVSLVAEGKSEGKDDYVGLIVRTEKSGKLNESDFAMFINRRTNELEYAELILLGSTGGFDWDYAKAHAGGGDTDVATGATALTGLLTGDTSTDQAEWREWESFYGVIDSAAALDHTDAIPAKTGATRTVTATYNAFNIAARYYYENYVKGDNA